MQDYFQKSDLKAGMVVETYETEGCPFYFVLHDGLINIDSIEEKPCNCKTLREYYENLMRNKVNASNLIIKNVYKPFDILNYSHLKNKKYLELIWTREPKLDNN